MDRRVELLLVALAIPNVCWSQGGTQPDLVLQSGHTQYVKAIAFSPDGRWLASASNDNTAKIWDLERGLELRTLRGHTKGVTSVAFSRDGRLVATAADDNVVKLWDLATGEELFSKPTGNHIMGMIGVTFDPSGKQLISLHQDRTVTVWDVATGQPVSRFKAGEVSGSEAYFTRLTPDGRWVMTDSGLGTDNRAIDLWDVTTQQRVYHNPVKLGDVISPALSPDGRLLVWKEEKSINLWDVAKGRVIFSRPRDPDVSFESFAFSPDGKILAIGEDKKQRIRLLDAATGQELRSFETAFEDELRFSEDGNRIAGAHDKAIAVMDLKTGGRIVRMLQGHTSSKGALAISPDGRFLSAEDDRQETEIWDLSLGRVVRRLGARSRGGLSHATLAYSPDGKLLASGATGVRENDTLDSQVRIWDPATGRELRTLGGLGNEAVSLSFSPDGRLLAAGDYNGGLKVWETGTWRELLSLTGTGRGGVSAILDSGGNIVFESTSVAFSPDGRWLAATRDRSIDIWTVANGSRTKQIEGQVFTALAFSPDSKQLASADSMRRLVEIRDVESGEVKVSVRSTQERVSGLAFSPDGRWLAGSGGDHTIRLWDVATGGELRTFNWHTGKVNAVAFTPDGRWLTSASDDGSVRVWNSSSGDPVALLCAMTGGKDWAVVTPDGLFDGSTDGAQQLVAWRVGGNLFAADRFYASNFTPALLRRLLDREPLKPGVKVDAAKLPPIVKLVIPPGSDTIPAGRLTVDVSATDKGGGISEVRLFHNGKLAGRRPGAGNGTYHFTVELIPGDNILRASASSNDRVEANDDQIRMVAESASAGPALVKPVLRLLVVGVSQYEDPKFDLPLARPDAAAIANFFERDKLFTSVDSIKLYDGNATKLAIADALTGLVRRAAPGDVLLIYLAGHGVGLGEQFYFLPHEMRRESDDDAAIRKYGIPASVFADALMQAKALKQVLILDTCESESALPLLAKAMLFRSRGMSTTEEKAVKMLARSYGVYLIAASTRNQDAYEVKELGHGVLTYTLLTGLGEKGEPKAPSASDGIITVESLVQYAHDQVPELTEKYHHEKQYPVTSTTGTDFPLWAR